MMYFEFGKGQRRPYTSQQNTEKGECNGQCRSCLGIDFVSSRVVYDTRLGVFLWGHGSTSQRSEHAADELLLHLGGASAVDGARLLACTSAVRQ